MFCNLVSLAPVISLYPAGTEHSTMVPLDTMNIVAHPIIRSEENLAPEASDNDSEIRLLLFPSQIQKVTNLLSLLAYFRDLIGRLLLVNLY